MRTVLTINGGSSSIRFAFFDADAVARAAYADAPGRVGPPLLSGKMDRIGSDAATLDVDDARRSVPVRSQSAVGARDHREATEIVLNWLAAHPLFDAAVAIGHRVVHGMQRSAPERVTPLLLSDLRRITPYDPEHLPREIDLIESVGRLRPHVLQVACFDTAFHRSMPRVATLLPIPRRYQAQGLQRYGFHGLSYTYLMSELVRSGVAAAARGRVILAHLGNGASLAAVRDGKCVDTSMGFTPTGGVVMGTRTGDLDPGVLGFLAQTESLDAAACQRMVTHESGLLGVSETSADVRNLLAHEATDVRAAEALALFCYQIKKCIGAFAAVLGGLDTLVFAGGIGENSPVIRARICAGLAYLGIDLSEPLNARSAALVSSDSGAAMVRVMRTDEESVIAQGTWQIFAAAV